MGQPLPPDHPNPSPFLLQHHPHPAVLLPSTSAQCGLPGPPSTDRTGSTHPGGRDTGRTVPGAPAARGAGLQHAPTPPTPTILPPEPSHISRAESLQHRHAREALVLEK
ncbi:hypothetical protein V1264_014729 [Littorina saxatilis]|uniref:Uncharacterized protein n=1 Tax=Littorina saxatilis TaxID=31220 RepID=A0AAN9BWF0_9CAEN